MTQAAKEQILYTWMLAGKLHRHLEQKIVDNVNSMSSEFMEFLEQYQNAVIIVGETLEQCMDERERKELISLLEQYCEGIYQLSQSANNLQSYYVQSGKVFKEYTNILKILEELPVKKTALFLPYKFSMWDSLESIYLAVKKDAEWNAVVMPIPYVERNQEQKTEEWKYEGAEFKDIPVVSYNDYNIFIHKPDVIYIHNPYDGHNLVTSVAPEFYTSELKKYCKTLVYVPYFFTGRCIPELHLNIPSYENMDYIILPSEEAKEQMKKFVPEDKLLTLGSPKIDRMLRMSRLKEMPKEWHDRIKGRKTILYNIGLNAILNDGFQVILKMRYIFNYFKRQSNLVLWWRPHPLMKSTIKSMCPELLGAYEAMEKAFILENIGIYDTTPDSNMAIAATDAFLGDSSSMCALYGIMGKPIFLTNNSILDEPTNQERRKLWLGFFGAEPYIRELRTYPICDKEDNFYYYSWDFRTLFKMSKDMTKVQVVRRFDEPYCKMQAFHTQDLEKMEIYFYPMDKDLPGKIYHVAEDCWSETKQFLGIPLAQYGSLTRYKNQWIITPGKKSEFIFIQEETGERSIHNGYEEVLLPYCQVPEENLFGGGFQQIGNKIYMLAYRINKLMEFNMEDKSWRFYDIGREPERFSTFWFDDVDFWFLAWNGSKIVRWNKETGEIHTYSDMPQGFLPFASSLVNPHTPAFLTVFDIKNGEVIIFPYTANMILKLDKETGNITQWKLDLPYEEGQRISSLYNKPNNYGGILWYDNTHLFMQSSFDGSVFLVDLETEEWERKQCLLSEEDYEKYCVPMEQQAVRDFRYNSPYYFYENALTCTLKDMMDYFASGADMQEERQHLASTEGVENADGSCGRKVHEYISNNA